MQLADLFSKLTDSQKNSENIVDKEHIESKFDKTFSINLTAKEIRYYSLCKDSIEKKCKLKIIYIGSNNRCNTRIIHPYKKFIKNMKPYLVAFCELRDDIRTFRLSRIRELKTSKCSFEILSYFDESIYDQNYKFSYRLPYSAKIKFNEDRYPNNISQKMKTKVIPLNDHTFQIEFRDANKLIADLISLNLNFTILSPQWLRNKLKEKLQRIFEKNV